MNHYPRLNISILFAIFLTMCSSPESDWQKAEENNTIEAYQSFLNKYPESSYASEVQEKIGKLIFESDWQKAEGNNTIEAYQSFLNKYPESSYASEVQEKIGRLIFDEAQVHFVIRQPLGKNGENAIRGGMGTKFIPSPSIILHHNIAPIIPSTIEVIEPSLPDFLTIIDLQEKSSEIWTLVELSKDSEGKIVGRFDTSKSSGFSVKKPSSRRSRARAGTPRPGRE